MADLTTVYDALGAGHQGPIWLLDLDCHGRVYHVADVQVEVQTHQGPVLYQAGLSPLAVADAGELLESIGLDIDIGEDWATLIADGALILEFGTATVRRWWPGQDLRYAELVISGQATSPEWGSADEPLTITISREVHHDLLLDAQAVVDETTWPDNYRGGLTDGGSTDWSRHESAEGQAYPLILGRPGYTEPWYGPFGLPTTPALIASVFYTGTPPAATPSTRTVCVIAAHRVQASQVRLAVYDGQYQQNELRDVVYIDDALGRTIAYVDFFGSGLDAAAFGQNPKLWVGWGEAGGGLTGPDGELVRGAGDVIEWLLRTRTTRRVDWARMAAVRAELNRYQVDAWVNAQVETWQWIEEELGRLLPIVVLESTEGLYLKVVRWRAEAREAAVHLDADAHQVDRETRLVGLAQPIENEIEVQFQHYQDHVVGRRWVSAQVGRLSGDGAGAEDSRVAWHERCAASHARYGHRPRTEPVQATWVWDPETAERIAQDLADRYALPMRTVRYTGGWELDSVEAWDVVTVTDSEVALDAALALVSQVTRSEDGLVLDLILLPA